MIILSYEKVPLHKGVRDCYKNGWGRATFTKLSKHVLLQTYRDTKPSGYSSLFKSFHNLQEFQFQSDRTSLIELIQLGSTS